MAVPHHPPSAAPIVLMFARNVAERVTQNAKTPFYKTVARVLGTLFSQDVPA